MLSWILPKIARSLGFYERNEISISLLYRISLRMIVILLCLVCRTLFFYVLGVSMTLVLFEKPLQCAFEFCAVLVTNCC